MKVAILRTLPDPSRISMDLYAQELIRAIKPLLNSDEKIISFPGEDEDHRWGADLNTPGGKLSRYGQQYVRYGLGLKKMSADLFHIVDHSYAHLIPFLKGRNVVVTFHDALLPSLDLRRLPISTRPLRTILAQKYCLSQMRHARHIITVSRFSQSEFLRYCPFPQTRVHPIYEGISSCFFESVSKEAQKAFRKKWGLEGQTVILLAGRTDPHKNIEGTLPVLRRVISKYPNPLAILKIGSPFTDSQQRIIADLGLTAQVRYLGSLPVSELPLVYQVSDVLVFLSWYEGFGFPALEAMASGVPAVVSNRGSLPEIVGDAACVVDPQNIEEAAQGILKVLTDAGLRSSLIAKGKKRAGQFSWAETARQTLKLYREVYQESAGSL